MSGLLPTGRAGTTARPQHPLAGHELSRAADRHVGEQLGLGRSLDEVLGGMRMVAEGVRTSSTVVELADRYGLQMPIARTINDVVTGRIRAADAYRGLIRAVPAGHESQPG